MMQSYCPPAGGEPHPQLTLVLGTQSPPLQWRPDEQVTRVALGCSHWPVAWEQTQAGCKTTVMRSEQ